MPLVPLNHSKLTLGHLEKSDLRSIKQFGLIEKNRRGVGSERIWRGRAVARIDLAQRCAQVRYGEGKVLFFEVPVGKLASIRHVRFGIHCCFVRAILYPRYKAALR